MGASVKRGYSPGDGRDFSGRALETMKRAGEELCFLTSRGYPIKGASTFVGNHYLLSERQRTALTRVVAPEREIALRAAKRKCPSDLAGETVYIDGFNQIITLEVALSGSPVFRCMDGTFRDLAGLRGTYRLIDKTDTAVSLILSGLRRLCVKRAEFLLDEPVSNSGRLKSRIAEIAENEGLEIGIAILSDVDKALGGLPNVISSDSVILDRCRSWFNLTEEIVPNIPGGWIIDWN